MLVCIQVCGVLCEIVVMLCECDSVCLCLSTYECVFTVW